MKALFFCGFPCFVRLQKCPVHGEVYTKESLTVQGDDINVAETVRRMSRGEIVPMRELRFGEDAGEMDVIDIQQTIQDEQDDVSKDQPPKDELPKDELPKDELPKDETKD